ncbi:innexin-like protein, partial [Leptotrombidium deliense]
SMLFYVPRYIWKVIEGEKLRDLITDLRDNHIASLHKFDKFRLLQDVADSMYLGSNYCMYFIFCEVLCLVHLLCQIWFTNLFLGGEFYSLGPDWYWYANSDYTTKYDPLIKIFPRFVKCTFHKYGHSGTLESLDSMCFLLMNIVNEKIYVTLWFWFFFLLCFTTLVLMFRVFYVIPYFRYQMLLSKSPSSNKIALRRLCRSVGCWFVLYFIAKNIKPSYFVDMFDELLEIHFDKKGRRILSSKFKDEVEKGNKADIKPKKQKSKSKSKSSKTIGWKTDDPSWDSKNDTAAANNDDWADSGTSTANATTNDDWGNDSTNKADEWADNPTTEPSAPADDWNNDGTTDWPTQNS